MHRLNCLSNTVLNKSNEAQMVSGQRTLPQLEDGLANAAQLGGFSALAAQLEDNSLPYAQAVFGQRSSARRLLCSMRRRFQSHPLKVTSGFTSAASHQHQRSVVTQQR